MCNIARKQGFSWVVVARSYGLVKDVTRATACQLKVHESDMRLALLHSLAWLVYLNFLMRNLLMELGRHDSLTSSWTPCESQHFTVFGMNPR